MLAHAQPKKMIQFNFIYIAQNHEIICTVKYYLHRLNHSHYEHEPVAVGRKTSFKRQNLEQNRTHGR